MKGERKTRTKKRKKSLRGETVRRRGPTGPINFASPARSRTFPESSKSCVYSRRKLNRYVSICADERILHEFRRVTVIMISQQKHFEELRVKN